MHKILHLGSVLVRNRSAAVFCCVKYNGKCLSITGVIGPTKDGDCRGSCGQILDELFCAQITPASGWTQDLIASFLDTWEAWHLNDMRAGSPRQREYLKTLTRPADSYQYAWAKEQLEAAGLNPDPDYLHDGKPYRYGHAWLLEPVPDDVLQFLEQLPESRIIPAWV